MHVFKTLANKFLCQDSIDADCLIYCFAEHLDCLVHVHIVKNI